ncbi:hypothetical protein D7V88_39570 [Corallococcus terminator]|uniref:Uncharacterized protein n=1 Tax=Corallococcus terminator TaxID=2316733 RepID=A0A3A8HJD7_9BACT|nr:hypothetical protein D7V88_39570 [Corallococcus terminator]
MVRNLRHANSYEGKEWLVLEGSLDGEHWQQLSRTVLRELDSYNETLNFFLHSDFADLTEQESPYGDSPILLGDVEPAFVELPLADAAPIRYVRLSVELLEYSGGTNPGAILSLSELSVFE